MTIALAVLLISMVPPDRLAARDAWPPSEGPSGVPPSLPAPHSPASAVGSGAAHTDQVASASRPDNQRASRGKAVGTSARTRSPRGFATYYAKLLDGRRTASGIPFDNDALVAAHPRYPFGTIVRVTNLSNGRSTTVRIVDRGPSRSARASGVIIDLSRAAARELGFISAGRTRVRLDVVESPPDAS